MKENILLREQYQHILGVQFTKKIYGFNNAHYVHNVIRDKDGDICVVDQFDVDYKLRDVEFYVSDEHEDVMSYAQYVVWCNCTWHPI